mgnify:CR=1 FL=1
MDACRRQTTIPELYTLSFRIAAQAHRGQVDKGGRPYLLHPLAVARQVSGTESKILALLHDVPEDTDVSLEQLAPLLPPRLLKSLKLLTRQPGQPYSEYIEQLAQDPMAAQVKLADLTHNMDLRRIPHPTEKDFQRLEKYQKAYTYLKERI